MNIVNIIGGFGLLAFGRKLFWLFVAVTGFFAGYELATRYLKPQPAWVAVVIAVVIGILGALLAYFLQKVAIGVAGFFAGAYIASRLITYLSLQVKGYEWLVILLGGIIGIILMFVIFDWALIILSSLAGAILVVEGFKLTGLIEVIVGAVLLVAGIIFQAGFNRRSRSREKASD